MNRLEFVSKVKKLSKSCEDFNTNNAWGFGGAYGQKYEIDGAIIKIAKACFRHAKPYSFVSVETANGKRIENPQTKKGFNVTWKFIETLL